jgi:hypothetical protein
MEDELQNEITRLEALVEDQENLFKTMFLAGFNSTVKDPSKAWIKFAKEESNYSFECL